MQDFPGPGLTPASTAGARDRKEDLDRIVRETLVPVLGSIDMLLAEDDYRSPDGTQTYCLAEIPPFETLLARSREFQVPVFELTDDQIGPAGTVAGELIESKHEFERIFERLAAKVDALTNHAVRQ